MRTKETWNSNSVLNEKEGGGTRAREDSRVPSTQSTPTEFLNRTVGVNGSKLACGLTAKVTSTHVGSQPPARVAET